MDGAVRDGLCDVPGATAVPAQRCSRFRTRSGPLRSRRRRSGPRPSRDLRRGRHPWRACPLHQSRVRPRLGPDGAADLATVAGLGTCPLPAGRTSAYRAARAGTSRIKAPGRATRQGCAHMRRFEHPRSRTLRSGTEIEGRSSNDAVREARFDRPGRLADLAGLHDLRPPGPRHPRVDPRRGGVAPADPAGAGGRDQLPRHGERLLRRHQRGDHRPGTEGLRPPRRGRARHQGARQDPPRTQRRRTLPQGDHVRDRPQPGAARHRLRRPVSDPPRRPAHPPSRRRWRRCTTW